MSTHLVWASQVQSYISCHSNKPIYLITPVNSVRTTHPHILLGSQTPSKPRAHASCSAPRLVTTWNPHNHTRPHIRTLHHSYLLFNFLPYVVHTLSFAFSLLLSSMNYRSLFHSSRHLTFTFTHTSMQTCTFAPAQASTESHTPWRR